MGYTSDDLKEAVKNSLSMAQVLVKLNLKVAGGNYDHLRRNIAKYDLDISHFTGKVWSKNTTIKDWINYKTDAGRKKVLIKERGHQCQECDITEWRGEQLILELHHIDGNRTNNDPLNLKLLCCNCHSITHNWRSRKLKKDKTVPSKRSKILTQKIREIKQFPKCQNCDKLVNESRSKYCSYTCSREASRKHIPSPENLLESFKTLKSFVQVAKHYNVSDNAVRKWVTKFDLWNSIKN